MTPETLDAELDPATPASLRTSRWMRAGKITAGVVIAFTAFELLFFDCSQFLSSFVVNTLGIGGIVAAILLVLEPGVLKKLLAIPVTGLALLAWLVHPVTLMCG